MKIDKYDQDTIPTIQKVNSKNIPQELKDISQWTCWAWKWKGEKWTKPPCDQHGQICDHHKSDLTFKQALKAHKNNPSLGIGISMRKEDQICGIDIDPGPDGKIPKKLKKAIKSQPSYYEISPSGKGYRIFGLGSVETHGSRKGSFVESYYHGRYLTVTGDSNGATGRPLTSIDAVADWMIKGFGGDHPHEKERDNFTDGGFLAPVKTTDYMIMLEQIPSDGYEDWVAVGMALHHEFGGSMDGLRKWDKWSSKADNYAGEDHLEKKWKSFGGNTGEPVTGLKIRYLFEKVGGVIQYDEPRIVPFTEGHFDAKKQPQLPLSLLPPDLQIMTKEVSRFIKTTDSLIISSLLGVFSAAIAKSMDIIERGSVHHQCSLGIFQGIPTGGRKSAIDNIIMKPFNDFEKSELGTWQKKRSRVEAKLKEYTDQIAFRRKQIRAGADGEELDTIVDIIADLESKIVEIDQPAPRYICSDITEEELSNLMGENNESMFVASDEGRNIIKNIVGRYSTGEAMGIYINGLTGSPYKRSRVTSKNNVNLDQPCLNLMVKLQNDALIDLISNEAFIESGFSARLFIGIFDIDIPGQYRIRGEKDLDESLLLPYHAMLRSILDEVHGLDENGKRRAGGIRCELSEGAKEMYINFSESYADKIETGEWTEQEDRTNKMLSRSIVMASILTVIHDHKTFVKKMVKSREKGAVMNLEIKSDIYQLAWDCANLLTTQTVNVLEHARGAADNRTAKRIVESIRADILDKNMHGGKGGIFPGSVVSQKMSKAARTEWKEMLSLIQGCGYFVEVNGGKYRLNEQILNGEVIV